MLHFPRPISSYHSPVGPTGKRLLPSGSRDKDDVRSLLDFPSNWVLAAERAPKGLHDKADPKDYRWSGYGEAAAGGKLAREGLAIALSFRLINQSVTPKRVMEKYRSYLCESGQPRAAGYNGEKPRRGFTPEEIAEILANGGKLTLANALLCKLRYFIDGFALGSRGFLQKVFKSHRNCFGPKRKTAARPLRGIRAPGLYVARALRMRPIG